MWHETFPLSGKKSFLWTTAKDTDSFVSNWSQHLNTIKILCGSWKSASQYLGFHSHTEPALLPYLACITRATCVAWFCPAEEIQDSDSKACRRAVCRSLLPVQSGENCIYSGVYTDPPTLYYSTDCWLQKWVWAWITRWYKQSSYHYLQSAA